MDIPAPRIPKTATEFEQKLELLQAILEDEQKRKALVRVTGKDAQEWLDLLQLLAEYPDVPKALRSSIFSMMIRLSRNSGLYPTCLTIQNVEKLGKRPEGGGSFGDVWKGKIGRTLVCIKVIRAFSVSEIETLAKESVEQILKVFAGQVPFAEIPEAAVLFEVLFDKKHPTRPDDSPKLLDPMWDIMVKCWDANPLDRPIIAEVMNQIRVLNSKHNRESEADNEWSDPQYTQVWNDVELYPLDPPAPSEGPPAPPADPPAARPAWRAVYPRSSRKKRREAASPPPPLRIDLPPPLQIDPRTQHSWAQWQRK
ncbi:hypothetical protein PQX77_009438 [Marasmius sp. AFHP31]|nr:hypothetical protein PQX77_009438 [Marasmius sp. AFHP31]